MASPELIAKERQLLADALQAASKVQPRRRKLRLRKVSEHVVRSWVSAGCFGPSIQWRLKSEGDA
jgi:hypothetical protein